MKKVLKAEIGLDQLRGSLDNIDNAILLLLVERFKITHTVGLLKKENRMPARDEAREEAQFARFRTMAREKGLDEELIVKIYRLIIDAVVEEHKYA
ncbi:chorismate mutase [Candidatus Roizmanbacteria bacterium]|nr:chorismate mutase [Candidatus Roizmanbacteria bacterium]